MMTIGKAIKKKAKKKTVIVKEGFDYYYDKEGNTIVTVCCVLTDSGVVGRGIAVLSEEDFKNERASDETGRQFARCYALRIVKNRKTREIKNQEAINRLIQCKCPFIKRAEKNPELSWWWKKVLFGKKKMHDVKYRIGYGVIERPIFIYDGYGFGSAPLEKFYAHGLGLCSC